MEGRCSRYRGEGSIDRSAWPAFCSGNQEPGEVPLLLVDMQGIRDRKSVMKHVASLEGFQALDSCSFWLSVIHLPT